MSAAKIDCWCQGRNERCAWCGGTGRRDSASNSFGSRRGVSRAAAAPVVAPVQSHSSHGSTSSAPTGQTTCPLCGVRVRKRRLARHLKAAHVRGAPQPGEPELAALRAGGRSNRERTPAVRKRGPAALDISGSGNLPKFDGSHGFHSFAREEGRFGSHPAHDDYGEESEA